MSLFDKFKKGLNLSSSNLSVGIKNIFSKKNIDQTVLSQFEELLIRADVVSLVEKASEGMDEEKLKKTEEQFKKGLFTLDDYLSQLRQMKKMGGMDGVLSLLPGVSKIKKQMENASIDEKIITTNEAIILSMTKKERGRTKSNKRLKKKENSCWGRNRHFNN